MECSPECVWFDNRDNWGLTIRASSGISYETGTPEVCPGKERDATSLRGGLMVSIDELSVGGAVMGIDNKGAETTHSDVGVGWVTGWHEYRPAVGKRGRQRLMTLT